MPARFFVNGAGDFQWSNPANWSLTSGGAGGQTVPTSADDVTLDVNSPTCYLSSLSACRTLTVTTGFVNVFGGGNTNTQNLFVTHTTGTTLTLTPGSGVNSGLEYISIFVDPGGASSVSVNVNLGNSSLLSVAFNFNYTSASSTVTLVTNGIFARTADLNQFASISMNQGTFSTGTVNPTFGNITCLGGTFNFNASTVTMAAGTNFGADFTFSAQAANLSVALGTSVINGASSPAFSLPSFNIETPLAFPSGFTATISAGATQTLNITRVRIQPTASTTLRTITSRQLTFVLASGVNITAGVITANESFDASAVAGYSTLPTLTVTSITGTSTSSWTNLYVNISEVGFTSGAISLTYSSGTAGNLYYQEASKGTVNVTGAITLTDNGLFTSPTITINSQAAFSGTPTVTYSGLNASVRGYIPVSPARNVSLGAIVALWFRDISPGGNVTASTITLGGTLLAVTYDGKFEVTPTASHNFTSGNIGPGTGSLVDFRVEQDSFPGTFIAGTITAHTRFRLRNYGGTVNVGAISVVANTPAIFADNFSITGNTITLTSISFSGTALTTANFVQIGDGTFYPVETSLTISSSVVTGSSATNRLALFITANNATISFPAASIVHSISQLLVFNHGSLTFAPSQTLNLNENAAGTYPTDNQDPVSITSGLALGATTLPSTLTSTYTSIAKKFFINAPSSAVTFGGTYTLGVTPGTRGNVDITCASFSGSGALSTSGFAVTASGAVSQAGIVTISSSSVTNPDRAIYVSTGATSTFGGIDASAITDDTLNYLFSFVGNGALTISSTITGPSSVSVTSSLIINRTAATTFSGAISNIYSFDHTSGNITFTGALAIGIRTYFKLTSGFTVTPNTSVITISGTSTFPLDVGRADLDHGGYTLNSVIFSATANKQYIRNSTSAGGLTLASLTSNGAAVPYSFLVLDTNVNVTGSQLTIAPNSTTNRHLVCSNIIGTPRTLTAATRTINAGADFQDITAAGATPWNLSAVSVGDAGGNSNITFSTPVTRTLAVTTGSVNWDATATWTGAVVPLAHDVVNLSAATSGLTINTNNRVYLGTVSFANFAGTIVITASTINSDVIALGNTFDFSSMTGSIANAPSANNTLVLISRGAATLAPPSSSSAIGVELTAISTLSLAMAGPNNLNLPLGCAISSASFTTNTGSRICNLSVGNIYSLYVGVPTGTSTSLYNAETSSDINSSTVTAAVIWLQNSLGTSPTITTSQQIAFYGSVNFANASISSTSNDVSFSASQSVTGAPSNITLGSSIVNSRSVYFSPGFTFNSAAATFNVRQDFRQQFFATSPTWVEGTTQINFTGDLASGLGFGFDGASFTVHRVTINDTASTLGATDEIFFGGFGSNPAIRFFDASAMRRPLKLGNQQMYGGLNAVFSNRAYTFLQSATYKIVGPDPLFIPYAFCNGANVASGSIVAYGPANLGNNVGNITFPSRLRYYAFVDTATSMTVPNDYNGMGLLLAIGGGATPSSVASVGFGKGGGGGGGTSYTFLLSPNNLTAPVVAGQTIFIRAGSYAVAPVANTVGGNGNISWANLSANVAPTTTLQGVLANGGSTTTSSSAGGGGSTTGAVGHLRSPGGSGSPSSAANGSGGGGGSARFISFSSSATNIAAGGAGTTSASLITGQGGSGSVAGGAAGTAGLSPTAGANGSSSTGAGGGGGGGNSYNPAFFGTVTTTNATRANGTTTLVFNVTGHGFIAGDRIFVTTSPVQQRSGTWSKSAGSSTVTVSIANHGLIAGQQFYFSRTSGSIVPSGTYTVTTATTNSFTFTFVNANGSVGSCFLGQAGLSSQVSYAVTVNTPDQFQVTSTVNTILYAGQFSYSYGPVYVRSIYRGANGGSGALNSAEDFIRYYNNAYAPGYFGIGGAGGGGGNVQFPLSNLGNSGGNGGDGGIGAGGGGIGVAGSLVPTPISSVATSGRGGPGFVMFIYALRANNQSAIQGQ